MVPYDKFVEQLQILRCQTGDKDTFVELIERYEAPLRYFITRLLGSNNIAVEDVFQETWLTVIRRIHSLKNNDRFSTWLYRIARNNVYRELRRKRQLSPLIDDIVETDDTNDAVSISDDAAKVHKCLDKLQPEHKEVLLLRFLEQLSYEEISRVIDCHLGTVKSRIYYAKRALRQYMEV